MNLEQSLMEARALLDESTIEPSCVSIYGEWYRGGPNGLEWLDKEANEWGPCPPGLLAKVRAFMAEIE